MLGRSLRGWPHTLPLAVLCASAAILLGRVVPHPLALLPGSEAGDVYKHTWAFWHTLAQVRSGDWPATRLLAWPKGGSLLDVMSLPALLLAPVTLLAGPVLSENLWVLLSLVGAGFAPYLLVRRLSAVPEAAVGAGLLVQWSPVVLGHALDSGVTERLGLWVFPLLALGCTRALGRRRRRGQVPLAVAVVVAGLPCPTWAALSGVLLLALVTGLVVIGGWRGWRDHARRLASPAVAVVAGCAVVFLVQAALVGRADSLAGVGAERVAPSLGLRPGRFEVATLQILFDPVFVRNQAPKRIDDELYLLTYVGWTWLATTLAGLVVALRRGRRVQAVVIGVALVFLGLSLGPVLLVGGGVENPLFYTVAYLVPFYGGMPAIWEQVAAFLALSPVALGELAAAIPSATPRRALVGGVVGLTLVEIVATVPVSVPIRAAPATVPSAYAGLAGDGALVDIPRLWRDTELMSGAPFLFQTVHHLPIAVAINSGRAPWDHWRPVERGYSPAWGAAAACLGQAGFRWVAVHPGWLDEAEAREGEVAAPAGLVAAVGSPVAQYDGVLIFELSKSPPGAPVGDCPVEPVP